MSDRGRHSRPAHGLAWRRSTVAAVVAFTCAAIGVGSLAYATHDNNSGGPQAPPAAGPTASTTPTAHQQATRARQSPRPRGPVMAGSVPVHLAIPSVNIETNLLRLGLNPDDTLQVPWKPLLAGWYQGSPTPGQLGPAIIAGHVDSWTTGPAVFYHLGEIAVGAHVLITRADSTVATFKVTAVNSYPKTAFPTHLVYGNVNRAELRLITCADWNITTQEYDDDVVVFAQLALP